MIVPAAHLRWKAEMLPAVYKVPFIIAASSRPQLISRISHMHIYFFITCLTIARCFFMN